MTQSLRHSSIPLANRDGQIVGFVSPGGWLEKRIVTARHLLRFAKHGPSWASDVDILDELASLGGIGLRLFDEHGVIWTATLDDFAAHGERISRGHGAQIALARRFWKRSGGPSFGGAPTSPTPAPTSPAGQQLDLFATEVAA